jgi:hypothetical protein
VGIDLQRRDFESYPYRAYLGGEFSKQGWRYYYLYGLGVKLPTGTLILIACSLVVAACQSRRRSALALNTVLLAPAVVILVLVSSQTGMNEHVRYVFPVLPYLYVCSGNLVGFVAKNRWLAKCLILTVAWIVTSSLCIYPHSLSFFNEIAGGPASGHRHLIHSNLDWGQDLGFLASKIRAHDSTPVHVAYFGGFAPSDVGFDFRSPPTSHHGEDVSFPPGYYAVSVQILKDPRPFRIGARSRATMPPNLLEELLRHEPEMRAGYSIHIFRIGAPIPAAARRREMLTD